MPRHWNLRNHEPPRATNHNRLIRDHRRNAVFRSRDGVGQGDESGTVLASAHCAVYGGSVQGGPVLTIGWSLLRRK